MKRALLVPASVVLIFGLTTCKKKLVPGTYESAPVPMGNGTLICWSAFDAEGNPTAIGMTITESALDNLPDSSAHHSGNDHANVFEAQLPPEIVTKTPFQHVAVNWNPAGHTPGIYDKPHFDFHFYMISSGERKQIPDYAADSLKFKSYPPADYLPANFICPGGGEPEMGAHWIDKNAPELPWNGGHGFTETWVCGTYNGEVTFYEPMITYSFLKNLENGKDWNLAIPRPAKVKKSGYYPTKLQLKHKDGTYVICLESLEYRKAE